MLRINKTFLKPFLLLALIGFAASSSAKEAVRGAIPADVFDDYKAFLGDRDPRALVAYGGKHSRRDVVEVALILRALSLGGFEEELSFAPVETYSRQLIDIEDGFAALPFTSVWSSDAFRLNDKVYVSESLIAPEEFVAGFYIKPGNTRAAEARTISDLATLKAVSNPAWQRDWKVLNSFMPEGHVYKTVIWPSMVKMVEYGRVDFLLAPFQPTRDLSLHHGGIRLVPIEGIKVSLGEGRRVIFSKKHPKGLELFTAFAKGLEFMRKSGELKRAYTESGFFNNKVQDWVLIEAGNQ